MNKTTFFVRIFYLSPCLFTQILSRRAHWMRNLISHPTNTHNSYFWWTPLPQKQEIPEKMWWALPIEIWVKTQWDMSKIQTKKVVFLMKNMSIQPLWLTYFIEILLVLEFQLTKTYFGMFSYKAHFRPQISSNDESRIGKFS